MQTRSKERKYTTFKSKERTTCALPSVLIFANDDKEDNYTQEELKEINDLVQRRRANRKVYSKTLIDNYTPLTKLQKVKVIKDMDESSTNRFKMYSDIFDQIKTQIHDINNRLTENKGKGKDKDRDSYYSKTSKRKTDNLGPKVEFIEKQAEEDCLSPKYIVMTTVPFALESYFDQEAFNENINCISLRESPMKNSSILLAQSKRKGRSPLKLGSSKEMISFLRAKEEFKRLKPNCGLKDLNDLFNPKGCYCESSCHEDNGAKYCSNQTEYCNCCIQ